MDPIIDLESVTVQRETRILSGVNWRVLPGEDWVILGANGSGKTTLLQLLTGYLTASKGSVRVAGKTFGETDWREIRQRIGLVSSGLGQRIDPGERAIEVVASGVNQVLNLWKEPAPEDREAAMRMLKRIGCSVLEERAWGYLSLGERQRLLIARALLPSPEILILDEPCAGLDPVARETFLNFLERLKEQRGAPSLLFVTHHVEEIRPMMSHCLLLRGGRACAQGPIRQVLNARNLSAAFRTDLKLRRGRSGYRLKLNRSRRRIA